MRPRTAPCPREIERFENFIKGYSPPDHETSLINEEVAAIEEFSAATKDFLRGNLQALTVKKRIYINAYIAVEGNTVRASKKLKIKPEPRSHRREAGEETTSVHQGLCGT